MPEYLLPPWTAVCQVPLSSTVSGGCSSSCPLSHWCHLTVSYSKGEGCPRLLLASVFPSIRVFSNESRLFQWVSSLHHVAKVLECHLQHQSFSWVIQGWFPLGLTGLISLQSKGLSRVFSSTTVQKHQFFSARPSLWSNSHIHTWLLEEPKLWLDGPLLAK